MAKAKSKSRRRSSFGRNVRKRARSVRSSPTFQAMEKRAKSAGKRAAALGREVARQKQSKLVCTGVGLASGAAAGAARAKVPSVTIPGTSMQVHPNVPAAAAAIVVGLAAPEKYVPKTVSDAICASGTAIGAYEIGRFVESKLSA